MPVPYYEMPSSDRDENYFLKEGGSRERKIKRLKLALFRNTLGPESIVLPFLLHRQLSEVPGMDGASVNQPGCYGTALPTHPLPPLAK